QNAGVRGTQMGRGSTNPRGTLWLSTNLNERDVITGGEAKLEQAIREADVRYRPSAIIVISSCVPGIIGDDIDGVAQRVQPEVSAKICPIHCEGFRTKIMATAYDAIYHSVARNLLQQDEERQPVVIDEVEDIRERLRRSRLVNLMNVSSIGTVDENEMKRLLQGLGLEVQIFPCAAHPDDFRKVTEAALSISTCPTHDDYFVKHLQQEFGVPYVQRFMPIGIENTNNWLRAVAQNFNQEAVAEEIIARETRELEEALAPFRKDLAGKKAMISAGEVRALSLGNLLQELGMEIVAVRPYHYDEFGETALDQLLAGQESEPVINVATVQPYESVNLIGKTKPDIYFGHPSDSVWAAKTGIPTIPVYHGGYTYVGYAGVFEIARRAWRVLANPAFNRRLKQHVRQPYQAQWLQENAFSYIKEGVFDGDE
ncbi:MAG: nitrogenase component 1, partial [bacterium]